MGLRVWDVEFGSLGVRICRFGFMFKVLGIGNLGFGEFHVYSVSGLNGLKVVRAWGLRGKCQGCFFRAFLRYSICIKLSSNEMVPWV